MKGGATYSIIFPELYKILNGNIDLYKKMYMCPASKFEKIINIEDCKNMNECIRVLLNCVFEKVNTGGPLDNAEFKEKAKAIKARLNAIFAPF